MKTLINKRKQLSLMKLEVFYRPVTPYCATRRRYR